MSSERSKSSPASVRRQGETESERALGATNSRETEISRTDHAREELRARAEATTLRLKLLANGYTPLPNKNKKPGLCAWGKVAVTEAEIQRWGRSRGLLATGIRVENGLVVIDIDVDDEALVSRICNALMDIVRVLGDETTPWLERSSGGFKIALYVRTEEPFKRKATCRYVMPGYKPDDAKAPTALVEIYGGASDRQFGSFGAHSHEDDDYLKGAVLRSYKWADLSPADVPLTALPLVTEAQIDYFVHAAEQILKDAGCALVPVKSGRRAGDGEGKPVYVLTDDMSFRSKEHGTLTLAELRSLADAPGDLRVAMDWLEGPQAVNTSKGSVWLDGKGRLVIYNFEDETRYMEASERPTTAEQNAARQKTEEVVSALADKLKEKAISPKRLKIKADDDHNAALAKFVQLYAYCPTSPLPVVPIRPEATNGDGAMTVANARLLVARHAKEERGPKGGVHKISVVDSWINDKRRVVVAGVRVAPGKEWPVYTENGVTYVNSYRPPDHSALGGKPDTLLAFIAHLVPDAAEREWLLDRLAHKLAHPDIPGPAVIFVAHEAFGTGRGTFFRLLRAMIGPKYSCELPFADFMGKTYQAQYNEWLTKLLVCINESSDEQTGSRYDNRRAAYEHLKELCEPRPHEVPIKLKHDRNYTALVSASFFIATNHADALPLPGDDRRFAVLTNGEKMTAEEARCYNGAVDHPAQVAAFYHWIMTRGYGGFDPFADPPLFAGKVQMADTGVSDLDEAWADALAALPEVFTMEALYRAVMAEANAAGAELPRSAKDIIKARAKSSLKRVGLKNGRNGCVRDGARKHTCYCKNAANAKKWTNEDHETLKAAVLGAPKAAPTTNLPSAGAAVDNVVTFSGPKKEKRGGQYGARGSYKR